MTGFIAILVGILVWALVPESVRWLTAKGRYAEACMAVAKQLEVPIESVPLPTMHPTVQPRSSLAELYSVNPRLFWQTLLIWGGSSSAAYGLLSLGPDDRRPRAPRDAGASGKIFHLRRGDRSRWQDHRLADCAKAGAAPLGIIFGFVSVAFLCLAGYYSAILIGTFPLFIILTDASALG
jgi:MFS transporter, putative metabolite:H+ symporter